jgi:lipid-A-disaccharide synthase
MQQIALRLKVTYPGARFITVAVDEQRKDLLRGTQLGGFECEYNVGSVNETARSADFAIVASGSATLQVAAAGCPMVVMYQSSRILWHLAGRWLVTTKYLSLVNVLADRELVPEFMPYFGSIEPLAGSIEELLKDRDKLTRTSGELVRLAESLRKGRASERLTEIIDEMLR